MTARRMRFTTVAPDRDGVFQHLAAGAPAPSWAPAEAVEDGDAEPAEPEPVEPEPVEQPQEASETTQDEPDATSDDEPEAELAEDLIGGESHAVERPTNNGSLVDWQAYARAQGATDDDIDGRSRNELRATYGG